MRVWALLVVLVCALPAHGETIYAAVIGQGIWAVDTASMTSTQLVHSSIYWYDIAFAPNGKLYGSDAYNFFEIDIGSGRINLIGEFGRFTFINGMTFVGDTLYASGATGLYTINLANGQAQLVGYTGYTSSGDLQWFQGALYLTATSRDEDWLVRVDRASGKGSVVGPIGFESVYGLTASSSELFGLTQNGDLLTIDTTTGAGRRLGNVGGSVFGASSKPQEVPEPGGLLLLGSALTAIGMRLHGRQRNQAADWPGLWRRSYSRRMRS